MNGHGSVRYLVISFGWLTAGVRMVGGSARPGSNLIVIAAIGTFLLFNTVSRVAHGH